MRNTMKSLIDTRNRMRFGHRWTQAELLSLMQLWEADEHVSDIATSLGASTHAVVKMVGRLRAQGLPLKRRRKGRKIGDRNRGGKPWTQAEVEYLVTRRRDRATMEEIGAELGRSYAAIAGMIENLRKRGVAVPQFGAGMKALYDVSGLRVAYDEAVTKVQ